MGELIVRLRIKEDYRNSEKRASTHPMESKANVVEHASKIKKRKSSGESSSQGSKGGDNKKYKFNEKCYICDKEGHRAKDCRSKGNSKRRTSKKPAQAHMTEVDNISNGVDDIIFLQLFPRQILSKILKNGGWTLVLLAISVATKRCSHLIL